LPQPDTETLASIVDLVEQHSGDPRVTAGLAAILQRAAAVDRSLRADLDEIATMLLDVELTEHAESVHQAHEELEVLLSAPEDERPLNGIFGDDHSRPELLLHLARLRLRATEDSLCSVLVTSLRLGVEVGRQLCVDPSISAIEKWEWTREQVWLDLEEFGRYATTQPVEKIHDLLIVVQWIRRLQDVMGDVLQAIPSDAE
jgi:hypothetical protein